MAKESFKKEIEILIQNNINAFSDFFHLDAMSDYKEFLKFENDKDFWYGYLLGRIEMDCANLFKTKYKRVYDHDEFNEMVEIVRDYGHLMKKRINEKIDGMFGDP
jgi:hypothetical protein